MANMLFVFLFAVLPRTSFAQVSDFKVVLLDAQGNAVENTVTKKVAGFQFQFTTTSPDTKTGSIQLPAGFLTAAGMNESFGVSNETSAISISFSPVTVAPTVAPTFAPSMAIVNGSGNMSGNASDSARRLAAGCEVTSATVNGGNLDLTLQAPGGGGCAAGSSVSSAITGSAASFNSPSTGSLSFSIVTNADPAQSYVTMVVAAGGATTYLTGATAVTFVSADLTSTDTNVGTIPTGIVFKFTPTNTVPIGGTVDITASQTLWAATTGTVSCTGFSGTSFINSDNKKTRFSLTAALPAGTEVTLTCSSGTLFAGLGPIGPVTFTFETSVDIGQVTSADAYTVVASVVASDPITFYGGEKIKFWLPIAKPVLLLETPDLKIFARAFQGPTADLQWFDSLLVTLPSGSKVIEVATKRSRPRARMNATGPIYRQLDVFVGNSAKALESSEDQHMATSGGEVRMSLETRYHSPPRLHKEHLVEYVHVETDCVTFMIFASHAGNEFRDDVRMQEKYRHIDLNFIDIKCLDSFSGPLPELWGVKPRSPQVEAMLVPPSERSLSAARVCHAGEAACAGKGVTF